MPALEEPLVDLAELAGRLASATTFAARGRITELAGLVLRAQVPGVRVGELCHIVSPLDRRALPAEVVGFRDNLVFLMPLGDTEGIGPDSEVHPTGQTMSVPVGPGLLGRVIDGLGKPIDGKGPLPSPDEQSYPIYAPPPDPMKRRPIRQQMTVGVRSIDACLSLGRGQRMGIFASAGDGKSSLLGMMARHTEADINVIGLVGERGREVLDFIETSLGEAGLARSVVVVATSDQPALLRLKAAYVATAVAEHFRDQGRSVLFMMDSLTRFARAQREVGLALGEPPAREGFPPSVFAILPRLLERTGNSDRGSITALYTVLIESEELSDPIGEEVRSILDGHIYLARRLASRGHYPAIDVLKSTSRLFELLAEDDQRRLARRLRELLAVYEKHQDLILIGAYVAGSDPLVDEAIARRGAIEAFLKQDLFEKSDAASALAALAVAVGEEA
ncbi:MAG TPA: FliI/YscN family ATPase [Thermoanaerobaculia bacterium]|nr:FliI/YscN family ATPase [Thermoanaerobaculia bacterium]